MTRSKKGTADSMEATQREDEVALVSSKGGERAKPKEDLLKLPAEIRSQIFELLLAYEDDVRTPMRGLSVVYWEEWHLENPLHPSSLFLASKQIRKDAMNVYFRCNHITLGSSGQALPQITTSLEQIVEACGALSTNLTVRVPLYNWACTMPSWIGFALFVLRLKFVLDTKVDCKASSDERKLWERFFN
ncbi:hypothetical protein LTR09_012415 [Extremus antarcticus]|uniref:Uncharacterized protein n=1 Tax=Extremus antarcticus TaxID=702011 RepID=A0AAJ0DA33_9PEZI|nr:hypothetical protein LTR09_012415 [Extremus antarcticus]